MKFIPILFSTPMVQAILEGRKTMTRRVIKLGGILKKWEDEDEPDFIKILKKVKPKYGQPGDILWVRETFSEGGFLTSGPGYVYKTGNYPEGMIKWKPSMFMPKSACRIFLKITDVRVEKLEDISYKDAIAEGINHVIDKTTGFCGYDYFSGGYNLMTTPVSSFLSLWRKVNGLDRYAKTGNPWVWVISFDRIDKPENFI